MYALLNLVRIAPIFCVNNIPADVAIEPTRELQQIEYQFVYAPIAVPVAETQTSDGQSRRDEGDISNDKDGV